MPGPIDFNVANLHVVRIDGRRTVAKPLVVGTLTAMAAAAFDAGQVFGMQDEYAGPLRDFEEKYFGRLAHGDFREPDGHTEPAGRWLPTTGWHRDGAREEARQTHTYIIGSGMPRFNTEYVTDRWSLPKWVKQRLGEKLASYQGAAEQEDLTAYFKRAGGTRHIGAHEVVLLPDGAWHRTSPHHPERTEQWPFLRYTVVRKPGL